jgi:hypothetical protein
MKEGGKAAILIQEGSSQKKNFEKPLSLLLQR